MFQGPHKVLIYILALFLPIMTCRLRRCREFLLSATYVNHDASSNDDVQEAFCSELAEMVLYPSSKNLCSPRCNQDGLNVLNDG